MMHSALRTQSDAGRRLRRAAAGVARTGVACSVVFTLTSSVPAAPKGEKVVHGKASFERSGDLTSITTSHKAIINYRSFDIDSHETVRFIQPRASSRVLNRVNGGDPSRIAGRLTANGQVYITNPAGIYFAKGSLVDVGQLFAGAGQISDEHFLNNINQFTDLFGSVVNEGTIEADAVSLIGRHVANHGTIVANDGFVAMVAGEDVLLGEQGGRIMVKLEGAKGDLIPADTPGVESTGTTAAPGGVVSMAAGDMYALPIRHTGHTEAAQVLLDGGSEGVVEVTGTLDASDRSPGAQGGRVEVLGNNLALSEVTIDASGDAGGGTVLVGGEYQGLGDVRTAAKTYVGSGATIKADAITFGDGGRVILWGDDWTRFYGEISARGGAASGDGGFVEVSGKQNLGFDGHVDVGALNGAVGAVLLDPDTITIVNGSVGPEDVAVLDGSIFAGDGAPDDDWRISEAALEALTGNIVIEALRSIRLEDLSDNVLDLSTTGTAFFLIRPTVSPDGSFSMASPLDVIRTSGGNIVINAEVIILGGVETGGGDLTINATADSFASVILGGTIDLADGNLDITALNGIVPHSDVIAGSITMRAGTRGTSDFAFGAATTFSDGTMVSGPPTFRADVQTFIAGDGPGGISSRRSIDSATPGLTFLNTAGTGPPDELTLRQEERITEIPSLSQFGGTGPGTLRIQSDEDGIFGGISVSTINLPETDVTVTVGGGTVRMIGTNTTESLTIRSAVPGTPLELEGNVFTAGAPLTFEDPVLLLDEVAIDTTDGGSIPAGAPVTFAGTIDASSPGAQGLFVHAGEGAVVGLDQVGLTTLLSSVDVTGGSVSWSRSGVAVPLLRTTGPQRFESLVGDVSLELFSRSSELEVVSAADIFVGGAGTVGNQTFTAAEGEGVFRNTNGVFRSAGGDITFNADVEVFRAIQVETNDGGATTGRIEITGTVGRVSDTLDPLVTLTAGDGGVRIGGDVAGSTRYP